MSTKRTRSNAHSGPLHRMALNWLMDRANPEKEGGLGVFADTRYCLDLTHLLKRVERMAWAGRRGRVRAPRWLVRASARGRRTEARAVTEPTDQVFVSEVWAIWNTHSWKKTTRRGNCAYWVCKGCGVKLARNVWSPPNPNNVCMADLNIEGLTCNEVVVKRVMES